MENLSTMDATITTMTWEEYCAKKRCLREEIRRDMFTRMRTILMTDDEYKYSKRVATDFANDLLDPDEDNYFMYNDGGEDDSSSQSFESSDLGQLRKIWIAEHNERLLMLRFPVPEGMQPQAARIKLPLELDDVSRYMQNTNFVKSYGIPESNVTHKRIECYPEFCNSVNYFLHETCKACSLATIMFNGHGGPKGLPFYRSGRVPLNEIIARVQASMNINAQYPQAVDLIFAQCYGHVHDYPAGDDRKLSVVSLTSKVKPKTMQNVRKRGADVDVAKHYDMEDLAETRSAVKRHKRENSEPMEMDLDESAGDQARTATPSASADNHHSLASSGYHTGSMANSFASESHLSFGAGPPTASASADSIPSVASSSGYQTGSMTSSSFTSESHLAATDLFGASSATASMSASTSHMEEDIPDDGGATSSMSRPLSPSRSQPLPPCSLGFPQSSSTPNLSMPVRGSQTGPGASLNARLSGFPSPISPTTLGITSPSHIPSSPVTNVPFRFTSNGEVGSSPYQPAAPDIRGDGLYFDPSDIASRFGEIREVDSLE